MDIEQMQSFALKRLKRAHSLPRMDAEEAAQDAVITLVRFIENRGAPENTEALLTRIVDMRAASYATKLSTRSRKETPRGGIVDMAAVIDASFASNDDTEFDAAFDSAIRDLDPELQESFILTELRGVDRFEAAQLLGIPAGTVQSRADRARKELAAAL